MISSGNEEEVVTETSRSKDTTVKLLRCYVGIDLELLRGMQQYMLKDAIIQRERSSSGRYLYRAYLKDGLYKVGWVLNDSSGNCMVCDMAFSFFRRKHHCRCCGMVVCNACSMSKSIVNDLDHLSKTRICDVCVSERACCTCSDDVIVTQVRATAEVEETIDVVTNAQLCRKDISAGTTLNLEPDVEKSLQSSEKQRSLSNNNSPSFQSVVSSYNDISTVTDISEVNHGANPISTVSPTLVRKLAEIGFDGDNNSSEDDDTFATDILNQSRSENGIETASFLSASGSSAGILSTQHCFLDSGPESVSPLGCSVSPIRKRPPVMRTPKKTQCNRFLNDFMMDNSKAKHILKERISPPIDSTRRKSLGEIMGAKSDYFFRRKVGQSQTLYDSEDTIARTISASGSSLGEESARQYYLSSDISPTTENSGYSLSPNGEDIVVHETFHSPSFTTTNTPSGASPQSQRNKILNRNEFCAHLDKENLCAQFGAA